MFKSLLVGALMALGLMHATAANAATCPAMSGYTLATCDFFSTLDPTKWAPQPGSGPAAINLKLNNGGNVYGEVEAYLPNQYSIPPMGGVVLHAKQQGFSAIGGDGDIQCSDNTVSTCNFNYTSAEISGRGGIVVQPGFVEWKAILRSSANNGPWPALWLFSNDSARYAEIDIAESFSNDPGHVYMHLHYGNPGSHGNDNSIGFCPMADPAGNDWRGAHTFAVDWNPVAGTITGYIDGTACGSVTAGETPDSGSSPVWIPNVPLYPIANNAISPGATGGPYLMGVEAFAAYANNSIPAEPVPNYVADIQPTAASYEPGDSATINFTVHAGSTAMPAGNVQVSLMDFCGDGNGFVNCSSVNQNFPVNTYYYPSLPAIAAGASYSGSMSVIIPDGTPDGVYSLIFGQTAVGYGRLIVGSPLPPAP